MVTEAQHCPRLKQFAVRKDKMQREMVNTVRRCEELYCNGVEEHQYEMKGISRDKELYKNVVR